MLCQNCHKRVATIHFTQVVDNDKVEMYLCKQCVNDKNLISYNEINNISSFLSGVFSPVQEQYPKAIPKELSCNNCNMKFAEFQKIGKMGCDKCYIYFSDKLKPILKRLHGNATHVGRCPSKVAKIINKSNEIEKLKDELKLFIEKEEYEKAAEIRDKIRSLENE